MQPIERILRRAGVLGPVADPVAAFAQQLEQLPPRKAATLAREFYHAAALTGHPLVSDQHLTFLAHAPRAREVFLSGEFNQWASQSTRMHRLGRSSLFIHRTPLLEGTQYKFVVDGRWRPDPANPHTHPDGHGGHNSLLRQARHESTAGSRLITHPQFYSKNLRNRRSLVVYLPPGYDQSQVRFPVVYIMDGYENLSRGRLPELFDAEISAGRLPPLIALFIPHAGRKRGLEYTPFFRRSRLDAFHRFVALELTGFMDTTFRTLAQKEARTLLGQSFGGTVVTSLAIRAPQLFRNVLAQSGVYAWNQPVIPALFQQSPVQDLRLYLDCVNNRAETGQSRLLVRVLKQRGYPHFFRAVPSRHEYEDWRDRVADGLRYVWFDVRPPSPRA